MDKKDLEDETIDEREIDMEEDEIKEDCLEEDFNLELDKAIKEKEEFKDQLMRLQADFINYKKRTEKEKQATINFAIEEFVSDLLPILDNFERALESEENKKDSFYKGVNLIFDDFNKLLENNGVEEIDAVGEDFDPSMHHAVVMEESDEHDEGKVIEVLQTGYIMKDKVIRPCMVKVSK